MSYSYFYRHPLPALIKQIRRIKRNNVPKYYAVAVGRRVGIYRSWPSCKVQIDGISNAKYRRFVDHNEALQYLVETPKEPPMIVQPNVLNITSRAKRAIVYTDGSCWRNGMKDACAGIGVYWPGQPEVNVSAKLAGRQTCVRAELYAAIYALRQASELGIEHLTIYTDSHFVIQCATRWLEKWKQNGWKTYSGGTVKNQDDMWLLDEAIGNVKRVVWKAVPAHTGIPGNEEADRLANAAIANHLASIKAEQDAESSLNSQPSSV